MIDLCYTFCGDSIRNCESGLFTTRNPPAVLFLIINIEINTANTTAD